MEKSSYHYGGDELVWWAKGILFHFEGYHVYFMPFFKI